MSNSDYESYKSTIDQLIQIPGVTQSEAEAAARVLTFIDPVRRRTRSEQILIEGIYKKINFLEEDLKENCNESGEQLAIFIKFVKSRDNTLYYAEAVRVANSVIGKLPYLFAESPSFLEYLDNAIAKEKAERPQSN